MSQLDKQKSCCKHTHTHTHAHTLLTEIFIITQGFSSVFPTCLCSLSCLWRRAILTCANSRVYTACSYYIYTLAVYNNTSTRVIGTYNTSVLKNTHKHEGKYICIIYPFSRSTIIAVSEASDCIGRIITHHTLCSNYRSAVSLYIKL